MEPIKVVVHGAFGRMGQEVMNTLCRQPDLRPVGAADVTAQGGPYSPASYTHLTLPTILRVWSWVVAE